MERITEKVGDINPGTVVASIGFTGLAAIAVWLFATILLPSF